MVTSELSMPASLIVGRSGSDEALVPEHRERSHLAGLNSGIADPGPITSMSTSPPISPTALDPRLCTAREGR